MSDQAAPLARRASSAPARPEASPSASRKVAIAIGWPAPRLVKRVLPRRFLSPAITALAAARMCPVERKFSSSRTSAASGKSRVNLRMSDTSAPRQLRSTDRRPRRRGCAPRHGLEPIVLGVVDVLVLVGKDGVEPSGPLAPIAVVFQHREGRPEQEIAEIGRVRLGQTLLIEGVDFRRVLEDLPVDRIAAA